MTSLETLLATPIVHRVGWMLLHSLWEVTVVGLVLAVVLVLLKRRSASVRYVVGCVGLLAMAGLPMATLSLAEAPAVQVAIVPAAQGSGQGAPWSPVWPGAFGPATGAAGPLLAAAAEQPLYVRARAGIERNLSWIVAAWGAGVLVLSLRIVGGWLGAQRLRWRGCRAAEEYWQERMAELARRIGVSRSVQLLESAVAGVPTVIGHLRPVILLPVAALAGLAPQQVEAILAHELAHIRRHDYLVNLVQVVIETVLFYHPAVWWISRRIRVERENCCDDVAVQVCGDRMGYIRALVSMEELRGNLPRLAMASQGGSLLERVRRLVGVSAPRRSPPGRWMAGPVLLVVILAVAIGAMASARAGETKDAAETPAKADEPYQSTPFNRVHWKPYKVQEGTPGASGGAIELSDSVPKDFERNQPKDPTGRKIEIEAWFVQAPVRLKDAALSTLLGKEEKASTSRPAGKAGLDEVDRVVLSDRQVADFLEAVNTGDGAVLTTPRVMLRDHGAAIVQVQTSTSGHLPRQTDDAKAMLKIPTGSLLAVCSDIVPGEKINLHLLGRWNGIYQPLGPGRGDLLGLNEAEVQSKIELASGATVLVRMAHGSSVIRSYRERSNGNAKERGIDLLLEPDEKALPAGPMFVLLRAKILPQEATGSQPADKETTYGPTTPYARELVAKVSQLKIGEATRQDVFDLLGEPTSYTWGDKTFDKDNLPDRVIMRYPGGIGIPIYGGLVGEIRFEAPGPYVFGKGVRVGMAMDEALKLLPPPLKVVDGEELPTFENEYGETNPYFQEGVLYKNVNMPGEKDRFSYYSRPDLGVRMFFGDDKVQALYLTRLMFIGPQRSSGSVLPADAAIRLAHFPINEAKREDVVEALGKPQKYILGPKVLSEDNLPDAYCMDYGGGFNVWMYDGYVEEFRLEGQTPTQLKDYNYRGLRIGSRLNDVVAALGAPDRTVDGQKLSFEDGVLYKNIKGRWGGGGGYYARRSAGVRAWLQGDRVAALYVSRTQPPAEVTTFASQVDERLANVDINSGTADDIVKALGEPRSYYVAGGQKASKDDLPEQYTMRYPAGVMVKVNAGRVESLSFRDTPSYAFRGQVTIGTPEEVVFQTLGEPSEVVTGPAKQEDLKDGVLYRDFIAGDDAAGMSYYSRKNLGIVVHLHGGKVFGMQVSPTPATSTGQ